MARVDFDYEKANNIVVTPLQKKLATIGFQIERSMKQYCPVSSGRLRASISTNWTNSGLSTGKVDGEAETDDGVGNPGGDPKKEFKVVIGTNVFYAPFIEFGTSKMGATPFMRYSFEKYRPVIVKILAEGRIGRAR